MRAAIIIGIMHQHVLQPELLPQHDRQAGLLHRHVLQPELPRLPVLPAELLHQPDRQAGLLRRPVLQPEPPRRPVLPAELLHRHGHQHLTILLHLHPDPWGHLHTEEEHPEAEVTAEAAELPEVAAAVAGDADRLYCCQELIQ